MTDNLLSTLFYAAKDGGQITYKKLGEYLKISRSGAKYRIKQARKAGLLRPSGTEQNTGRGHETRFVVTFNGWEIIEQVRGRNPNE